MNGPLLDYTLREPVGVCAQIVPWNFPVADGRLEACPGPGGRQHRHPQAGQRHADHRDHARRDLPRSRHPGRRGERPHRPRQGGRRGAGRRIRWSTRSPSPAKPRPAARSWRSRPERSRRSRSSLAARARTSSSRRRSRRGGQWLALRDLHQRRPALHRAHPALPAPATSTTSSSHDSSTRRGKIRVGDPLEHETQMGPVISPAAAAVRCSPTARWRETKARSLLAGGKQVDRRRSRGRQLRRADRLRRCAARHAPRPGGSLRAGAGGHSVQRR